MATIFRATFPGLTGLTLNAELFDQTGATVSTITSGFVEKGNGSYLLYASIPAGQYGGLDIYDVNDRTCYAPFSISPQELENSAADVWTYSGSRTLTTVVSGASLVATVTGSTLNITRGVTFHATITGLTIPTTWAKIYFTAKSSNGDTDAHSQIQIAVTNPSSGSDGLLYINGGTLSGIANTDATLTIDRAGGNITIDITDDGTEQLSSASQNYSYDIKMITTASASTVLTAGTVSIGTTTTFSLS